MTRRPRTIMLLTAAGLAITAVVGAGLFAATAGDGAATTPSAGSVELPRSGVPEQADRSGPLTTSALRQTGERFYEPLNTGDVGIYDQLLAPNWESIPSEEGQELGPPGWKEEAVGFRGTFAGFNVNVDAVHASPEDSVVTVRCTFSGTQQGEFLGVPGKGQRIEFQTIDIHRIDPATGRIVTTWHVEDLFGAYQQALSTQQN